MVTKKTVATPKPKPALARFHQARGGRKTAFAIARIFAGKGDLTINGKNYKEYFKTLKNQVVAMAPIQLLEMQSKLASSVHVTGGGINAQAEAVRNAISKAIVKFDESFRKALRQAGFLTRDSRMVERKKYGLKKARRAPQWAKR